MAMATADAFSYGKRSVVKLKRQCAIVLLAAWLRVGLKPAGCLGI